MRTGDREKLFGSRSLRVRVIRVGGSERRETPLGGREQRLAFKEGAAERELEQQEHFWKWLLHRHGRPGWGWHGGFCTVIVIEANFWACGW